MNLIYLAGPYSDERGPFYVQRHIHLAREVGAQLFCAGHNVHIPHCNTANFDGVMPWRSFLDCCLDILYRCDWIVVLPGWEKSRGTLEEIDFAYGIGLPTFYWEVAWDQAYVLADVATRQKILNEALWAGDPEGCRHGLYPPGKSPEINWKDNSPYENTSR